MSRFPSLLGHTLMGLASQPNDAPLLRRNHLPGAHRPLNSIGLSRADICYRSPPLLSGADFLISTRHCYLNPTFVSLADIFIYIRHFPFEGRGGKGLAQEEGHRRGAILAFERARKVRGQVETQYERD